MDIPDAYYHYAAAFYSHIEEGVSSEQELIARGLRFLDREQFAELQAFIPHALAGRWTVEELQRGWLSSGSMICFNDHDLSIFLRMTLEVMASEGPNLAKTQ